MTTTFGREAVVVSVPDEAWEPTGSDEDRTSRLLAAMTINGVNHHLEAYAVKTDDVGLQVVADELFESNFEGIYEVGEPDKSYQTVEIKGRKYVLAVTPYC